MILGKTEKRIVTLLVEKPDSIIRDMSLRLGISYQNCLNTLINLELKGVVSKTKHGRRNFYRVRFENNGN